jgi:colicin import membrane protein
MKAGLTTSIALHAALLGFGLFTLSAPRAFEVADIEALPVDIVPIEAMTQVQMGDRKAPIAETPAPLPTEKPAIVPNAEKIGDNEVDTETTATPAPRPKPVEAAAEPAPAPTPVPKPAEAKPEPAPVQPPEPEPQAVAATEVTPQPQPRQEVKPDPVTETIVAENTEAEAVKLPETAPSPQAKPQPPKAQTAKTPERKAVEKPVQEAAATPKSEAKEFNADEVAALLNKEKASGGGARRSQEQAALGGTRNDPGQKLSQSEMDALRGQIQRCWNIPAGATDAESLKVSVQFRLDRSGALEGAAEIISGGGSGGVERAAAEAARRAVARCSPYNLPADKYETWAEVIVHFDPSEMF